MIRRHTSVEVYDCVIPDKFKLEFVANDLKLAKARWSEYFQDDFGLKETKERLRSKWSFPDVDYDYKMLQNKGEVKIEGARKYVVWGILNEIVLQAKLVMSDEEIIYTVENTKFVEASS